MMPPTAQPHDGAPGEQSQSALSANPSQSLSLPSEQLVSGLWVGLPGLQVSTSLPPEQVSCPDLLQTPTPHVVGLPYQDSPEPSGVAGLQSLSVLSHVSTLLPVVSEQVLLPPEQVHTPSVQRSVSGPSQAPSVLPAQSGSAQSICPSLSLSMPSKQLVSPTQGGIPAQSESKQSIAPSQSSSRPPVQTSTVLPVVSEQVLLPPEQVHTPPLPRPV